MKKCFMVLLSLVMLLSLAACSAPAASDATASASTSASASAPDASKAPDTSAAPASSYDKLEKIFIGCVTSLTGERAQNGAYCSEALKMWADETNKAGGLLGKQVEVVFEDDQSTDQGGANAYQKLMARGDISGTIVPVFSSITLALEPYIKQYMVPSFTGGSSVNIAKANNEYLWQIRYNDDLAGATMGNAAVKELGLKKIAIINESDSFGSGLGNAVEAKIKELGVEPAIRITYNKGEKNFTPFIAQIKESGADGIAAVSQQIEASLIMIGVKNAGLNIPCIGSTSYCSEIAINNAKGAAEGWYSVSDWSPTVDKEMGKGWVERYTKLYGHAPDLPSSCAWDSVLLISKAIENGKTADPKVINTEIAKLKDIEGVASVYTPSSDRICATTQFLTINKDGKAIIQSVINR